MVDIENKFISNFLDALDEVLNSNTFLLEFNISNSDIEKSIIDFIYSDSFELQILEQDIKRKWFNDHSIDYKTKEFIVKKRNVVNKNTSIITYRLDNPKEYLIGLLMAEIQIDYIQSYYSKQKTRLEAEILVDNFVGTLFNDSDYNLFYIKPDFTNQDPKNLNYFDKNEFASNTATAIVGIEKGYILLTNGID